MLDDLTLLVVDDEETICEGCRRIFSRQGFQVEKSSDPRKGLSLATENEYSAILLDIKMPSMDGIQFLEELRTKRPDVPVILMTGYPSIPNAASAVRFGASDYITKPFTPEEITQAVQRQLNPTGAKKGVPETLASNAEEVDTWTPETGEFQFLGESWFQKGNDGTVRVGAMLTRGEGADVESITLPKVADAVYQGLPLAGLKLKDGSQRSVPTPVSGVIVAVNPLLNECSSVLWSDPCFNGWVALIAPTRFEDDLQKCTPRRVVLANADEASTTDQASQLKSFGCDVHPVNGWDDLAASLDTNEASVVMVDAASFGEKGPELVGQVNAKTPMAKLVVIASPASQFEAAYRENKIFYYAVEPFADNEIGDILDAAFRPKRKPEVKKESTKKASDALGSIRITNRNGKKVCLLASNGLLLKDEGLGIQVRQALLKGLFPLETTLDAGTITQEKILDAARKSDRVLVLLTKDTGRLPGSLVFDLKGEIVSVPGEEAGKVTTLAVQPDATGVGVATLDALTTTALAEHIVQEMAAC